MKLLQSHTRTDSYFLSSYRLEKSEIIYPMTLSLAQVSGLSLIHTIFVYIVNNNKSKWHTVNARPKE